MAATIRLFGSVCGALLLWQAVASADQFAPVQVGVNTAPTEHVEHFGAKAPKGETGLDGVSASFDAQGAPRVTVNVNLHVNINQDKLGKPYTIKEGSKDCKGVELQLTEQFVRAHEMTHVHQLEQNLRDYLNGAVTYRASTSELKFNGTVSDPQTIQNKIQEFVRGRVAELVKQDQDEYDNGSFPPGSLEGDARLASCQDFLDRIGKGLKDAMDAADTILKDVKFHLDEATKAMDQASLSATNARGAADRALKAANDCDKAAFQKALSEYQAAKQRAEDKLAGAEEALKEAQDAEHAGALRKAVADYDAAKRANGITKFPAADDIRQRIDAYLQTTFPQAVAQLKQRGTAIKKRLTAAKETMDEAFKALEQCKDKGKITEKEYQGLLESYQPSGAATPPPGGGTQPPAHPNGSEGKTEKPVEGPTLRTLLQMVEVLEGSRGGQSAGQIYVPSSQPQEDAIPKVVRPAVDPPTRRGGRRAATTAPVSATNPPSSSTTVANAAPVGFPGRWNGDGGCGLRSLTIVDNGSGLVLQGMPGNGPVPLVSDGITARAQGVILFDKPNHQLQVTLSGSRMQIQGRNPTGGTCAETFVRG